MNWTRLNLVDGFMWSFMAGIVSCGTANAGDVLPFDDQERALIESHGPWPPAFVKDPSNRLSGNQSAIELGRLLFFNRRLAVDGTLSCATCHRPATGFTDGLKTAVGRSNLPRNTPGLVNLRWARWYGWGGGADSLWAQSIRPIVAPQEMASSGGPIKRLLSVDKNLACLYNKTSAVNFDEQTDEQVLVGAAKALAAFQETLVTGATPFDKFRIALLAGPSNPTTKYPLNAQRGLKLFIGKGQCNLCHFGPLFTNGEFGDIGIPFFIGNGKVDKGRYGGLQNLKTTRFSLTGIHSDDATKQSALKVRHLALQDRNWGEFKVPSLRNVAETAPYMHNGSLASLADVVRHYSEIDEERLHVDGEKILKPLRLTERESSDLVAFLKTLSAPLLQTTHVTRRSPVCSPVN